MLIEWTCPLLSESCRSAGSKAKVFANQRAFWALVPNSCNLLSTCLFDKLVMSFTEGLQCIFAFPSSFLMYFTMLSFVSFITFISSFALILCRSLSSSISRYNVSFSFSRFSNFCFHSSMSSFKRLIQSSRSWAFLCNLLFSSSKSPTVMTSLLRIERFVQELRNPSLFFLFLSSGLL